MSYKEMISKAIEASDFSIKEIAEQCKRYGVSITPSYISLLKSGKTSNPSEEVSRAISKVCGIDENLLILEAYLEKAPNILSTVLNRFRNEKDNNKLAMYHYIDKSEFDEEVIESSIKYIKERTLAQFIIDAYEDQDPTPVELYEKHEGENKSVISNQDDITFMKIDVKDNSMSPIISKGSKVYYEHNNKYKNGDIICFIFKETNNDDILIRKYYNKDNLIILNAFNSEYEPIICNVDSIRILGKINKIIVSV